MPTTANEPEPEPTECIDPRPDACECRVGWTDLPCWPCYRAGHETPNPNVERDDE